MPETTPQSTAYRPLEDRTLETRVIDRCLDQLAEDPQVSAASHAALSALLRGAGATRQSLLTAVRDARPEPEEDRDAAR